MKRLVALMMCVVSFGAAAQFPNLPYNPDENADGLIGVVDLQGLLSNYGNEFASAVVSEDGESAIVYMGDMGYPLCAMACKNLPGLWSIPALDDLGPVYDDLGGGNETWLKKSGEETYNPNNGEFLNLTRLNPNGYQYATANWAATYRCYCATNQLPRVEYSFCRTGDEEIFSACCQEKVENGWYPLNTTTGVSGNSYAGGTFFGQAFWRWAE